MAVEVMSSTRGISSPADWLYVEEVNIQTFYLLYEYTNGWPARYFAIVGPTRIYVAELVVFGDPYTGN